MPRKNRTTVKVARGRRGQSPKVRNEAMGEAFRELRQGSRTSPHRNKAREIKVTGYREDWD